MLLARTLARRGAHSEARLLIAVVAAQMLLGIWTVVSGVSMWVAVSHQVVGAKTVAIAAAALHRLRPRRGMTLAGGLSGALLLLAAQSASPAEADQSSVAAAPHSQFDAAGRRGADWARIRAASAAMAATGQLRLVHALQWERAGRGFRLNATLQRIESDAAPEVTRAVTLLLQPLVGEATTYLVAADGGQVDLVDPEGLWERVTARIQTMGAAAGRPEAKQMAQLVAALPAAERDRLASADIRALVAPANRAIPAAQTAFSATVSTMPSATLRTITKVEHDAVPAGAGGRPLEIDSLWTIDTATGLVMRDQRQSWIIAADGGGRTLVEDRSRVLELAPR